MNQQNGKIISEYLLNLEGRFFMGLWTFAHFYNIIPAFIIYSLIAVVIRKKLSFKDERFKYRVFKVLSITLLILEAIKQITTAVGGYDLYSLPFHYCSIFLYVLPLHAFYRGKHKKAVDAITVSCCAALFLFMLVMPAVVYPDSAVTGFFDDYTSMHTVIFHHLVSIYFLLMMAFDVCQFEPKYDLKVIAVFLSLFMTVAIILSFALETNFQNLYRCNLAPVEEIRLAMVASIGWLGHAIYVAVLFVLTILFTYAAYFLCRAVLRLAEKFSVEKNR